MHLWIVLWIVLCISSKALYEFITVNWNIRLPILYKPYRFKLFVIKLKIKYMSNKIYV